MERSQRAISLEILKLIMDEFQDLGKISKVEQVSIIFYNVCQNFGKNMGLK